MRTSNNQYGSYFTRTQSQKKKELIGKTTHGYLVSKDVGNFLHTQQNIAQRQRHGLFTQPLGLGPGDQYKDYRPQQVPKNVSVNQRLVQKVGPQLFSKLPSTNIDDLYKDKFRQQQLYLKQKGDLSIHDQAFAAGGKQKLVKHSQFEHQKEYNDKVYQTRDADGNVITGKKGILTNNMKKGYGNTTNGHLFGAYPYMTSPYDNPKDLQSKERLMHKAKILQPFTTSGKPHDVFSPNYEILQKPADPYQPKDEDNQFRSKSAGRWNYNNPNKKGFYGTFQQFPHYIEEGEKRKDQVTHQKVWKHNFNGTSKGYGQTLHKPCMPPSQMVLNEVRRTKN